MMMNPFAGLMMIPGGLILMFMVYKLIVNRGADFDRTSYQIGMIAAVAIVTVGLGFTSVLGLFL